MKEAVYRKRASTRNPRKKWHSSRARSELAAMHGKMNLVNKGGDTVSTEAVASRRHAGGQPPVTGWKLELPTTTWHLLLN
jgi:hypothetical protein